MDDSDSVTTSYSGSSVDINLGNPCSNDGNTCPTLQNNELMHQLYLSKRKPFYSDGNKSREWSVNNSFKRKAIKRLSNSSSCDKSLDNTSASCSQFANSSSSCKHLTNSSSSTKPLTNSSSSNKPLTNSSSSTKLLVNASYTQLTVGRNLSVSSSRENRRGGFLSTLRRSCSFLGSRTTMRRELWTTNCTCSQCTNSAPAVSALTLHLHYKYTVSCI